MNSFAAALESKLAGRPPICEVTAFVIPRAQVAQWVLRVASAAIFFGHGSYAFGIKESWIPFFYVVGMSAEDAHVWMPRVGALDIGLAALVLFRPTRIALLWMTLWALWTALLRPLSGDSILEFIERGGNWGAPLALLCLLGPARTWKDWLGGQPGQDRDRQGVE